MVAIISSAETVFIRQPRLGTVIASITHISEGARDHENTSPKPHFHQPSANGAS